jgi:transcriptional antiterminator RfaH
VNWYVAYTKRGQEERALVNLERQGFACYLPLLRRQKVSRGIVTVIQEPLFPRYLFVRLDPDEQNPGWGAVRSTRGITRLLTFGSSPATVEPDLVLALQAREETAADVPLFIEGERVKITAGAFSGIEAVYLMPDGESRALVLVELLQKSARLPVGISQIAKLNN